MSGFYLDPPRAKVERSIEHLSQLDKEIEGFLVSDDPPHRVHVNLEEEAGERRTYRIWVESRHALPLIRWNLLISDVVQNLRAALDYVAWEVAVRHCRGIPPKPNVVYFPVALDPRHFDALALKKYVSDEHWARLETFQPYKRTKTPERDPLAILHRVAKKDRHRILHPIRFVFDELIVDAGWLQDCELEAAEYAPRGTAVDEGAETTIGRVTVRVTGPNPQVKVERGFAAFIEFSETPRAPVLETITQAGPIVIQVVRAFDPELEQFSLRELDAALFAKPAHLEDPPA